MNCALAVNCALMNFSATETGVHWHDIAVQKTLSLIQLLTTYSLKAVCCSFEREKLTIYSMYTTLNKTIPPFYMIFCTNKYD